MTLRPFLAAEVQDRSGAVLATTGVNVWQENPAKPSSVGETYDYAGVTDGLSAADALVGQRNRVLVIGSDTYNVVDAVRYDVLPHLELTLRRVTTDG